MIATPNDGTRPSKLELDRYAAGELSADEAAALEARLDDDARAHLAAVALAKASVPPLDVAALRARAASLPADVVAPVAEPARAANVGLWFSGVVAVLVAAIALFVVNQVLIPSEEGRPFDDVAFRSGDSLTVHQLQGKRLYDYAAGTPVGEGDVLGFRVNATEHESVVLLSVDGNGTLTVFFPVDGDEPVQLPRDGIFALNGTVTLDGAPGPEVFVAVFDQPVGRAREMVQRTFQSSSHAGLVDWAEGTAGVDAVEVTRR